MVDFTDNTNVGFSTMQSEFKANHVERARQSEAMRRCQFFDLNRPNVCANFDAAAYAK